MKKLITLSVLLTLGSIYTTRAQLRTYRLDSLKLEEALFVRNATIQLTADSTFFDNDTLIAIVRSINNQIAQKNTWYTITVNRKVLIQLISNSLNSLTGNLEGILQEQKRARTELRRVNTKVRIIQSIRKFEQSRSIPKAKSIFEQLNTGFLDTNNFNRLTPD